MKKNVRNALAISGLALAIGAGGFTLEASANAGARIQRSHQERIIKTRKISTEKVAVGRKFVTGTVSAVSENGLTITSGSKTFTVNIATDTRLLNRSWKTITFSDIQTGNKVRVSGSILDTTVSAKTLRDISLS